MRPGASCCLHPHHLVGDISPLSSHPTWLFESPSFRTFPCSIYCHLLFPPGCWDPYSSLGFLVITKAHHHKSSIVPKPDKQGPLPLCISLYVFPLLTTLPFIHSFISVTLQSGCCSLTFISVHWRLLKPSSRRWSSSKSRWVQQLPG